MNNKQVEPVNITTPPPLQKTKTSLVKSWSKLLGPIGILILCTGALTTVLRPTMIDVFDYFQSDPLGPFYFTLLYATWVSICLSKTPVSIAGGYIFGFPFGLLLSFLGMMIAVFFAFFVVRHAPCTR